MTTHPGETRLDHTSLVEAVTHPDADAMIGMYADDAVLTVVDQDHPPEAPLTLTGIGEIGDFVREVCGRDIEHTVTQLVGDENGVAYEEHCRYPEGNRVIGLTVATLRDGRIVRQTLAQAWD